MLNHEDDRVLTVFKKGCLKVEKDITGRKKYTHSWTTIQFFYFIIWICFICHKPRVWLCCAVLWWCGYVFGARQQPVLWKNDRLGKWWNNTESYKPLTETHTHTPCLRAILSVYYTPYEPEARSARRELWELPGQADWSTDWSGSFWYWRNVDACLLLCVCVFGLPTQWFLHLSSHASLNIHSK